MPPFTGRPAMEFFPLARRIKPRFSPISHANLSITGTAQWWLPWRLGRSGSDRGGGWGRGIGRFDAPGGSPEQFHSSDGALRRLGARPVRGPRGGPRDFETLVGAEASDAAWPDADSRDGLAGHLRECCFRAAEAAARFYVSGRSPGVRVADGDRSPVGRGNFTPAVASAKLTPEISAPK